MSPFEVPQRRHVYRYMFSTGDILDATFSGHETSDIREAVRVEYAKRAGKKLSDLIRRDLALEVRLAPIGGYRSNDWGHFGSGERGDRVRPLGVRR